MNALTFNEMEIRRALALALYIQTYEQELEKMRREDLARFKRTVAKAEAFRENHRKQNKNVNTKINEYKIFNSWLHCV